MKTFLTLIYLLLLGVLNFTATDARAQPSHFQCRPTAEDEMGPFYRPGAPLRSKIGTGYSLTGTVKSATDCAPISSPLIEFWQAAPNGRYDDEHRAAIITGKEGSYRLETDLPAAYVSRPPHIHIRVSAKGYLTLVTQHYLQPERSRATFDLILIPIKLPTTR